jgi:hypothetical protein
MAVTARSRAWDNGGPPAGGRPNPVRLGPGPRSGGGPAIRGREAAREPHFRTGRLQAQEKAMQGRRRRSGGGENG